MHLSIVDWVIMVATSLGEAALFAILVNRRRWKVFPVFTAFMGMETVINLLFFVPLWNGSWRLYAWIYYSAVLIEFLFQLGLVWEIARIVLRPTGTWVRDARKRFILWGTAGILFAAVVPFLVTPPSKGLLGHMEVRASLFTGLVFCELIAVLARTAKSLGLGWRNHVMALGNGWTIWVVVAILVDGLHSYSGVSSYYKDLEHVRMLVFMAVVVYWSVQFWLEEPARQPIAPELSAYIQALHEHIKSDLDTLDAQG
jgi:hypothetical protein